MPDYKSMYYHLAGRTANAVDVLETTTDIMQATVESFKATVESLKANVESFEAAAASLAALKDKLKSAQQATEEMFISTESDDTDE